MTAGYSKKPLAQKLGIKAAFRIALINMPENYLLTTLIDLPPDVKIAYDLNGTFDLIQFFVTDAAVLKDKFVELKQPLTQAGSLWISWPKGSAKVPTDLTDNLVREIGLENGLVDVKVCAVDAIWSGIKFVYRLKDR